MCTYFYAFYVFRARLCVIDVVCGVANGTASNYRARAIREYCAVPFDARPVLSTVLVRCGNDVHSKRHGRVRYVKSRATTRPDVLTNDPRTAPVSGGTGRNRICFDRDRRTVHGKSTIVHAVAVA